MQKIKYRGIDYQVIKIKTDFTDSDLKTTRVIGYSRDFATSILQLFIYEYPSQIEIYHSVVHLTTKELQTIAGGVERVS